MNSVENKISDTYVKIKKCEKQIKDCKGVKGVFLKPYYSLKKSALELEYSFLVEANWDCSQD